MTRFLVTIVIFNIMFAHMAHTAGPVDENVCYDRANLTEERFFEEGGWTCKLIDSYAATFITFLNFEIPTGVQQYKTRTP